MTPKDLVAYFRTPTGVARAFGIKTPSVYGWLTSGRVPIDRQCQAEVITSGALKADRDELGMRPPEPQQAALHGSRKQMGD